MSLIKSIEQAVSEKINSDDFAKYRKIVNESDVNYMTYACGVHFTVERDVKLTEKEILSGLEK